MVFQANLIHLYQQMSNNIFISSTFDRLYPLLEKEKNVVVLIDKAIAHLYGKFFNYPTIEVSVSETNKTLSNVESITVRLTEMECDRDTFLLCVGGGILTDIGGFAASIYKRGIRCGYVPTTLLAQVDASVGGKTGVNLNGLKNILGTFTLPQFTYINTSTLRTLPQREVIAGGAELIKTFAIKDRDSFDLSCKVFKNGINIDVDEFPDLLSKAIDIKACVVKRDFKESGERKLLNFGHTFGHAIEKCASARCNTILHGEAVAKGMAIAALLSNRIGVLPDNELTLFLSALDTMGFDTYIDYSVNEMIQSIKNDKKKVGEGVDFVFLRQIGVSYVETITFDDLAKLAEDVLH